VKIYPYSTSRAVARAPSLRFSGLCIHWLPMWKKDLSGILARLDALETAPLPANIANALGSLHDQIVALRASSDDSKQQLMLLEARMADLTIGVAEGIKNYERSERRVQATVKRAKAKFAERGFESEGLNAEADDLHEFNGARGEEPRVPAVREEMEEPIGAIATVRGIPLSLLRRGRRIG